jgi:DNA polymerase III subunit gamma/tau
MADLTAPIYEATATKRRPKTFDELAGQEFVVSTLKNSLQSGSIAHAYLFSGPRGCGKTSAARILARSLNCEKGPEHGPCVDPSGMCDNCKSISAGASMDVIEIDGASNTSVNDVRQIKDEVLFPPQTGRYKIYIIDEVHMLSNSAFNALLKTIEEPPPYIIFIFATTELHKVPATIKSRCQQFSFRLIPIETIQEILKRICGETGIEAEDNALFWIAKESTGSLRDAFTLFDQVASFSGGHIRESLIREKLGLAGLEKINALAEACAANDTPAAFSLTDAILASGVAIEQLIIDLAGYYRSLLLLKNGVTRESLLGCSPDQFSAKVLETLDSIRLEQALEILLACYRDIRYSVSPRFELETTVSKLSWLNQWVSPSELKAALDRAQYTLYARTGSGDADEGGVSRPLAQGTLVSGTKVPETKVSGGLPPGNKPAQQKKSGVQSLAEEYRRMLAEKARQPADLSNGSETDDDEEPAWSGIIHNSGTSSGDSSPGDESQGDELPGDESPVDRVLRLIPGTVVN